MRDMMRDFGQVGNRNRLVGLVAAAFTFLVILIWGAPGIDPSLWDDVAVVAGVRPPREMFPGFWRVLVGGFFALFGAKAGTFVLPIAGAAIAAGCSYLVCLITRQILALLIRTSKPYPVWYRRIAPFFSFMAAVLFGVSEPLFRAGQAFSPDELRLFMLLAIIHVSLRWFVAGGRWRLFPLMALMGLFAAETPLGFVLPLAFIGSYAAVWFCIVDNLFAKPATFAEPSELPKWRMFFLFLGSLAVGVCINVQSFIGFGGAEACGMNTTMCYFRYGVGYWALLKGCASIIGWVLGIGFCVIPFIVAARVFPSVVRDDQPMPFGRGALLFFVGILATMQSGVIPATRFWTFSTGQTLVRSGFMMTFFVFCAVEAIALFGAAFAFECQRTYLTSEDLEEFRAQKPGVLLRYLVPALAALIVLGTFVSVPKTAESEMQRIVDDAIEETLDECGDAKWLFTDGRLDVGIELAAARRGSPLRTLNMMSGASDWEIYVRSRGFEPGSEDLKMAKTGIPALLRVWAGEKVNGMEGVAIQLGFEFWKREQKPLPTLSGMVAMEKGLTPEAAKAGIERATALARRILDISPKVEGAVTSSSLAGAFSAVNWRLSRFAHMRADHELANGLDKANSALRRMLSAIEYERQRAFMQLTPREGLEIALRRSNFVEAQRYSAAVLKNDADDPQANFAMGMSAIMDSRYKDAEFYLRRVLKRRPHEPAALNNLSIVCRKQRKYQEAEDFARQAIELLPNSPEVNNTLQDAIKKAP